MEIENTLAKHIASAKDKAAYDAACKRLLAHKVILAWILKSCVEEYRDCSIQEIAGKYIEGEPQIAQAAVNPDEESGGEQVLGMPTEDSTMHEGTITYDIRFYAAVPVSKGHMRIIINIEAQNNFYPGYPIIKRALYYCSRLVSAQYGTEFTGSHYGSLKKACSIWICTNPPENRKNSISRYSIQEETMAGHATEKVPNYDLLTAVMICLGGAGDGSSGILRLLEVLLSPERDADEKKNILREDFSIEMTRELESEVSMMCDLSRGIEERGIAKGILFSIRNLMESMEWSAEQAMSALKISEPDKPLYAIELENSFSK